MFAECKLKFMEVTQIKIYEKLFENLVCISPKTVSVPSSVVHFVYILDVVS
jgi:hypothetical protein